MVHIAYAPIDHWPKPKTDPSARKDCPFDAGWSDTLVLLDRELGYLRAQRVVLQTAHSAAQLRLDGMLRSNAPDPEFPGVIVSFESEHGPMSYATDVFRRRHYRSKLAGWQGNVRAIALGLEALRKVDRYCITTSGEQYRGFSALPAATAMGAAMSTDEALNVIADLASADRSYVHAGTWRDYYRSAAAVHHPDRGCSPACWDALDRAKRTLEAL